MYYRTIPILCHAVLTVSTLGSLIFPAYAQLPSETGSTNVTSSLGVIGGTVREVTLPDGTTHSVSVFLGIPYARPPVGDLRFEKPVRLTSLGQYFKADVESKACPQNPIILKSWMPGPADMSEDCLKLNVYVPESLSSNIQDTVNSTSPGNAKHSAMKPVMIWVHGGAFLIGQSRIYNGERLAVMGDVIVVTVNYRLGPLGFFSTGDGVIPGNAGLWDQYEAIAWVHEHITAFGGDPSRVTLFGESAGGASSLFQLLHPGNRGKIHRIISSSGTPVCPWGFSDEPTTKYAVRLAQRLGCGFDDYPGFSVLRHQKMVECLRTKSFEEIINSSFVGTQEETLFRAEWIPTVDRDFIKTSPKILLQWPDAFSSSRRSSSLEPVDNLLAEVDAMIGSNYNDGEAVAQITVQGYIKAATGEDFSSDDLGLNTVAKVFVPEVIFDDFGYTGSIPEMRNAFRFAYARTSQTSNTNDTSQNITDTNEAALQEILDITTDYEFLMPAMQTISNLAGRGQNLPAARSGSLGTAPGRYLYEFDRKYPYVSRPGWLHHAAHGDDLIYIFGFPKSMTEAFNITQSIVDQEWDLVKTIITYWTNFAKTGNPNAPTAVSVQWPEYDLKDMPYLYISSNMTSSNARQHLFADRVKLWSQTLPELFKSYKAASEIVGK